jgi:MAF protein
MNLSLLLASSSPRRRELLALTGRKFEVRPAAIDESPQPGEPPADYVLRLAVGKAHAAAADAAPGQLVLAADTIVADGPALLGKPADDRQAVAMLEQLRGRVHQVYTAIAVFSPALGAMATDQCASQVPMRSYTAAEIETYAASGDPLDKAGAYAIQHTGFHPVQGFAGCFASVMGLPLCHLTRTLKKMGISPQVNVPQACQAYLGYQCPVFQSVLNGENVG